MATMWESTPELCKINLFENLLPVEILVVGVETRTESNVEIDWKLPFGDQKYIIAQYLQSLNCDTMDGCSQQ